MFFGVIEDRLMNIVFLEEKEWKKERELMKTNFE